jgi:hypothetical protein
MRIVAIVAIFCNFCLLFTVPRLAHNTKITMSIIHTRKHLKCFLLLQYWIEMQSGFLNVGGRLDCAGRNPHLPSRTTTVPSTTP